MSSYTESPRYFTKKPVKISAMQYDGLNRKHILRWCGEVAFVNAQDNLVIKTLEGDMLVSLDDFIIKGVKDEFYPCKPDVFKMTYDPVYPQKEDEDA